METLLGDEERELRFLLAEHCHEIITSSPASAASGDQNGSNNLTTSADGKQHQQQHLDVLALQQQQSSLRSQLAHGITLVLAQTGWCALIDIFNALKEHRFSTHISHLSALTEDTLRAEVKRLMHHGTLRYDSRTGRYALDLLFGVLRVLFPLMAQDVIRQHNSSISEAVLQLLYEHHDLPVAVLVNMVVDRMPSVGQPAVDRIVRTLQQEGWIIQVSSCGGGAVGETTGKDGAAPAAASSSATVAALIFSVGINYAKFLAKYRSDICVRYVSENMSPLQRTILSTLAQNRKKETQLQQASNSDENPSPKLPLYGEETQTSSIKVRPGTDVSAIVRALSLEHKPLVQVLPSRNSGGAAAITGGGDAAAAFLGGGPAPDLNCRFNFENANHRARRVLMCAEVRARFGLLGQRVVKILMDHHALEDKSLAEEGLISLQDLHSLLLPMQQLGILTLQELMRTPAGGVNVLVQVAANSGPDRNMKQSIFLWRLQERNLLGLVRKRICKSICALRVRLRAEYQSVAAVAGTNNGNNNNNPILSIEQQQAASGNNSAALAAAASRQKLSVAHAVRARFDAVQEHLSKALVALYEELALTMFC